MALTNSYLTSTKNLESIINSVINAKAPDRFTNKFLEDLGYKSSNDRLVVGMFKALGLLDDSGQPLQRYYEFLDQTQTGKILAIGIEEAYGDCRKSTHNRRERPVYGHCGWSRGRFYYRITTFEGRPWDARDPHKTTFMALKHAIRLSIWRKQKETPGVEKAPGVSLPQRKESGRSGRDTGSCGSGCDPAIHARRLRVYHRPRRLRMASRISIILYSRRFSPANLIGAQRSKMRVKMRGHRPAVLVT